MEKLIIDANKNNWKINFKELIKYKDLFFTLAWRDFKVRYAQTSIGFLWAIIQPLVTLFILSLVFGKFLNVETKVPHLLFTITGMSIWSYFTYVLVNSGNSIIASQDMIKKIYFPRLIIPLSKAVVGFVDFGITLIIMFGLMIYYQFIPSSNIIFAPVFILMGIIAALSVGIWLSALTIRYRDFQHVVPFIVQIGLYITPIAYPAEFAIQQLPKWAAPIYYLNPMAGVVQGFRWSMFGNESPGKLVLISLAIIVILFAMGILYFRKIESEMADYI